MRILALFLLSLTAAFSQVQLGFSSGSPVRVNTSSSRDITLSGSAPAGVQFTVTFNNMANVSVSIGSQASSAGKTLFCAPPTSTTISCLVTGLNQNTITNGPLATVSFTALKVPGPTPSGSLSTVGGAIVPLSSTPSATPAATTGGAVSIPFIRAEDLNGDGVVDMQDMTLFWSQMQPGGVCTTGDLNGDGKCDVLDAQLIANAALGL